MKGRQNKLELEYQETLQEKNRLIARLRKQLASLSLDDRQREAINADLDTLGEAVDRNDPAPGLDKDSFPWLSSFLESGIFKGLQGQLNRFMQSEYFQPIQVDQKDLDTLARTQSELFNLIQDPEKLQKLLESTSGQARPPGLQLLTALKDEEKSTGKEKP